jgi:hypothetical protein
MRMEVSLKLVLYFVIRFCIKTVYCSTSKKQNKINEVMYGYKPLYNSIQLQSQQKES